MFCTDKPNEDELYFPDIDCSVESPSKLPSDQIFADLSNTTADGTLSADTKTHIDHVESAELPVHKTYNDETCLQMPSSESHLKKNSIECKPPPLSGPCSAPTVRILERSHPKIACPVCNRNISKKNIKRHFHTHTGKDNTTAVCVDKNQGIYAVDPLLRGATKPIHVIAKTFGSHKFMCSSKSCLALLGPCGRGKQNFMCPHLVSCMNASSEVKSMPLCEIVNLKMSEATKERLTTLLSSAAISESPLVIKYPSATEVQYFSVFSGLNRYWCPFGRVVVSFQKDSSLLCPCTPPRHNCCHKAAVRWALELEENIENENVDPTCTSVMNNSSFDDESCDTGASNDCEACAVSISEADIVDFDTSAQLSEIRPKEKRCHLCDCKLETVLVTCNAVIVDQCFIDKGKFSSYTMSVTLRTQVNYFFLYFVFIGELCSYSHEIISHSKNNRLIWDANVSAHIIIQAINGI